jgi:serine/threonine protein kinase
VHFRLCEGGELLDRILSRYLDVKFSSFWGVGFGVNINYDQKRKHIITCDDEILVSSFRGGKYSEEDAKAVMTQILNVVAFCHLQGVVHRDLKPEVMYICNFDIL